MGKGDSRSHKPLAATRAPLTHRPAAPPAAARPARIAKSSSTPPLTSRTTTLDDPLTTSLLAEIARRPATTDLSPEQIEQLQRIEQLAQSERSDRADRAERIDEAPANEPGDRDPDDSP